MDQPQKKQINIKAKDETLAGVYCNNMQILHTSEEFVIDFLNIVPPQGSLASRVMTSPAHFKRMIMAMQDNLKKYEEKHGEIEMKKNKDGDENNPIGKWEVVE